MRAIFTALLVSSCVLAPAAQAQVAERPEIRAGDRWQWAEYYSVPSQAPARNRTITAVSDEGIVGVENGEPLRLTRDTNLIESWRDRYSTAFQALRFPLEVGQRWRFKTDWHFKPKGSSGGADVEVEVLAHEKIRVVAGEFDAFKLRSKSTQSGKSPIGSVYDGSIVTATYWYAPAARAVVRSEVHNPYLGRYTLELVGFQPAP